MGRALSRPSRRRRRRNRLIGQVLAGQLQHLNRRHDHRIPTPSRTEVSGEVWLVTPQGGRLVIQTISHYRIIRKLGAGGMGDVYLAEDSKLDRRVAIKILPERSLHEETARRRLIQEARAAAKLDHPNICGIYEVGEDSGGCYIAMQFVEGETLAEKVRSRSLTIEQALDFSIQITDAICEAHSRGIVHRDIKPQNIMITPKGLIKVLDFGLAKLLKQSSSDTGAQTVSMMTAPGSVVGTLAYMSPEQLKGEVVDQRTDIFSLGAVIYEMVSGQRPFWAETEAVTAANVLMKEPPSISQLAPDVPEALPGIIEKALAKRREDRYPTADKLLTDLLTLRPPQTGTRSSDYMPQGSGRRIAPVTDTSASAGRVTAKTNPGTTEPVSLALGAQVIRALLTQNRKAIVIAVALIATAIVAVYLNTDIRLWGRSPLNSIAVLPFTFAGGSAPENEYLTDGLTDSLIRRLSQLTNLKVIASSSVNRYKGQTIDPRAIRKELNVGAIVTTKVIPKDDNLDLNVELIDTADASIIWAGTFTATQSRLLTLPIDMSKLISSRLQLKLSGQDFTRMSQRQTSDPAAYRYFLEGRYYWNKRMGGALRTAIERFQKAVEIDPNYALAHAGIAESWVLGGNVSEPPSEYMGKAKAAAETALKLDNTLAEAHAVLARVKLEYDWDWAGAEEEFRQAIDLNPSYTTAYEWYAGLLMATGRLTEASSILRQAYDLDPLSVSITGSLGHPFIYAGQYDEAEAALKKALEKDNTFLEAHFDLGVVYEVQGMHSEAISEFEQVRSVARRYYPAIAMIGYCYARQGKKAEAQKVLVELLEISKAGHISTYNLAAIYTGIGDVEQALDWLWKGYEERTGYLIYLKVNPIFASLRSHPRYQSLVTQLRLP